MLWHLFLRQHNLITKCSYFPFKYSTNLQHLKCSQQIHRGVTINDQHCKTSLACLFCAKSQYNITSCTFLMYSSDRQLVVISKAAGIVIVRWYSGISNGIIGAVHSLGIVTSHLIIQEYHSHSGIILIGWW